MGYFNWLSPWNDDVNIEDTALADITVNEPGKDKHSLRGRALAFWLISWHLYIR